MITEQAPANLTPLEFQQALEVLERAKATFHLTPKQVRIYKLLRVFVYMGVCAFLCAFVSILIAIVAASRLPELAAGSAAAVGGVFILVLIVATLASPVLLLLNTPLIYRILQQQILLRKLGLKDISISLWKTRPRQGVWQKVWRALVTSVGGFFVLYSLEMLYAGERDVWMYMIVAFSFTFGATIVSQYLVQRAKERLDLVADANQLQRSLVKLQEAGAQGRAVEVSASALRKVARIESAQIAYERARAVTKGVASVGKGYGIMLAREVVTERAALDAATRLKVEELIESIGANPRLREPGTTGAEGLSTLRTAEGDLEVVYRTDDELRQVQVVALRRSNEGPSSGALPNGSAHD